MESGRHPDTLAAPRSQSILASSVARVVEGRTPPNAPSERACPSWTLAHGCPACRPAAASCRVGQRGDAARCCPTTRPDTMAMSTLRPPSDRSMGDKVGLVPCADCGRQVSDLAPACPQCGRPMKPATHAETERCDVELRRLRGVGLRDAKWVLEAQVSGPDGVAVVDSETYTSKNELAEFQGSMPQFQRARDALANRLLADGWKRTGGAMSSGNLSLPRFARAVGEGRRRQGVSIQRVVPKSTAGEPLLRLHRRRRPRAAEGFGRQNLRTPTWQAPHRGQGRADSG